MGLEPLRRIKDDWQLLPHLSIPSQIGRCDFNKCFYACGPPSAPACVTVPDEGSGRGSKSLLGRVLEDYAKPPDGERERENF